MYKLASKFQTCFFCLSFVFNEQTRILSPKSTPDMYPDRLQYSISPDLWFTIGLNGYHNYFDLLDVQITQCFKRFLSKNCYDAYKSTETFQF